MKMIKFPSIEQFNTTIKNLKHYYQYNGKDEEGKAIYDYSKVLPVICFTGTVKLHGTNAGVSYNTVTKELWAQSRERILSVESDNAGFAFFVQQNKDTFIQMIHEYFHDIKMPEGIITIFGEWAGPGIQKGVAISQIKSKSFFIFGMKVTIPSDTEDGESNVYWLDIAKDIDRIGGSEFILKANDKNIYNIYQFPTYHMLVDLNKPELSVNTLISITEDVELECPVGAYFDISGVGEGVVWSASIGENGEEVVRFKVKGEKHSSSKVKQLASVDMEKVASINEFVEYAVTENRLNQGVEQVFAQYNKEPSIEDTGLFVKWVSNDVIKEETQVMIESGLEPKEVMGAVSKRAAAWFKEHLMKN